MINDAGKHEVKNGCEMRMRPRWRRRGDRKPVPDRGCSTKVKAAATSLGQGYQRVAHIPRWRGNRKLTLSRHTARWLGSVGPRGRGRVCSMRCPGAGASGEHESMKSRETLIRLKKFQVEERRRRVAQIEGMISEFERISGDLERDIKIEQDRSGIHDPGHFAYPTYAKAAIQRRDNLRRSASDLKVQLEDAKAALNEAFEEMKKVELLDERDQMRERSEEETRVGPEALGMMGSSARA